MADFEEPARDYGKTPGLPLKIRRPLTPTQRTVVTIDVIDLPHPEVIAMSLPEAAHQMAAPDRTHFSSLPTVII